MTEAPRPNLNADAAEAVGFGHLADALRKPPPTEDAPKPEWCGRTHKLGHCPKCVDRGDVPPSAPAGAPEPSGETVLAECDFCHRQRQCSVTPGTGGGGIECDPPCAETLAAARQSRRAEALRTLSAESESTRLRAQLKAAESQLAAVRKVISRLGDSFERTSMYMAEEQRTGKATALSITRMSARKAALEQVLEELRNALTPVASPGAGEGTLCGVTAWNRWSLPCDREPGHTGTHSHDPTPGRSGK